MELPAPAIIFTFMWLLAIYLFPQLVCLFCCREICGPIWGIYKSLTDMNVETGPKATQFLFWEFIHGIHCSVLSFQKLLKGLPHVRRKSCNVAENGYF